MTNNIKRALKKSKPINACVILSGLQVGVFIRAYSSRLLGTYKEVPGQKRYKRGLQQPSYRHHAKCGVTKRSDDETFGEGEE